MPNYNFETLHAKDFELLVRDLYQREYNITLESFKTGRDSGIDLRYCNSTNPDDHLIIQAKHWIRSGITKLIYTLEKAGVILDGSFIEGFNPGARAQGASRLVESDVAVASYSQNLYVDPPMIVDLYLVFGT